MDAAQRSLPQDFRHIDTKTTRTILVEGGSRLLKAMPENASARIQRDLEAIGVEIRVNSYVTEVDAQGVRNGDEHVAAENVFWAAGVQGSSLASTLGVELDRAGRIVVGPDLSIPGHPQVFAIGDIALAMDAKTGHPVPGVAQGAIQAGRFVAKIIRQEVEGLKPQDRPAFTYFDKGSMAIIGRGKAISAVGDRYLGGFIGWLAWIAIHAMFLVGFRSKVSVVLIWLWSFLTNERAGRIITGDPDVHVKQVLGAQTVFRQSANGKQPPDAGIIDRD
jgi:NADH dehydrogenase